LQAILRIILGKPATTINKLVFVQALSIADRNQPQPGSLPPVGQALRYCNDLEKLDMSTGAIVGRSQGATAR
jgi:hypothetical protein